MRCHQSFQDSIVSRQAWRFADQPPAAWSDHVMFKNTYQWSRWVPLMINIVDREQFSLFSSFSIDTFHLLFSPVRHNRRRFLSIVNLICLPSWSTKYNSIMLPGLGVDYLCGQLVQATLHVAADGIELMDNHDAYKWVSSVKWSPFRWGTWKFPDLGSHLDNLPRTEKAKTN